MPERSSDSVAQPSQKVIPENRNNSQYYKVVINELLLLIRTTYGLLAPRQLAEFLKKGKEIGILSPQFLSIYNYVLVERTTTRQRIIEDLGFTESYVYSIVKKLVQMEYIKKVGKLKVHVSGGHKPALYAVNDITPDEIAEARVKEEQRTIPGYNMCRSMTQYLLHDYIPTSNTPNEITLRQIKIQTKDRFDVKGYNMPGIYELVSKQIQKEGNIKVWR